MMGEQGMALATVPLILHANLNLFFSASGDFGVGFPSWEVVEEFLIAATWV